MFLHGMHEYGNNRIMNAGNTSVSFKKICNSLNEVYSIYGACRNTLLRKRAMIHYDEWRNG
jgi:hypothetical protein